MNPAKLYAFDIQEDAVRATTALLEANGYSKSIADGRFILQCATHEEMDAYVSRPVKAVLFNLGYLPGGDKEITTSWSDIDTTTDVIPKVPDQYAPTTPVMSMNNGTMNILVKIGDTNDGKGVVQVRMLSGTGTLTSNNYIRCTLVWRRPTASELT